MLREKHSVLKASLLAVDLAVTVGALFAAYWLRSDLLRAWFVNTPVFPFADLLKVVALILPLWWLLHLRFGRYQPVPLLGRLTVPILPVLKISALGMLIAIGVAYFLNIYSVNRSFVFLFIVVNVLLQFSWRILLLLFSRRFLLREDSYDHVLVVSMDGSRPAPALLRSMDAQWGIKLVASLRYRSAAGLEKELRRRVVDDVVLVAGRGPLRPLEDAIAVCRNMGAGVHVMTGWLDKAGAARVEDFCGYPLVTIGTPGRRAWERLVKAGGDFVLAGAALVVLSPVMLVTALLVKLTSRGPVFFSQARCGLQGRQFKLYKFRSMVRDAEGMQAKLKKKNEMSGPVFKIKDDPRLTPIGAFLRRTSLDELPQLFNVLKGEISLVGPRPLYVPEADQLAPWQRRRNSVKPGITCLWQIGGRNEIDFEQWMELDLKYIDTWSLWLDFKILVLTVFAVLLQRGAR